MEFHEVSVNMEAGLFQDSVEVPNQFVETIEGVHLYMKREDLLHPQVSGNKFRKLKYNLEKAQRRKETKIITFGGAFSNHISATAAAGRAAGFCTVGIIRGEELGQNLQKTLRQNPTLNFAHQCGMQLEFISREAYRNKDSKDFMHFLNQRHGRFFLIPEGGTNSEAVKGCTEILQSGDEKFDVICSAVGTGGTLAGISLSASRDQQVLGFSALKGSFLEKEVGRFTKKNNWSITTKYHFGGYAKVTRELIHFINFFKERHGILLDPVYTGKMLFGIYDLIEKGYFPQNTCILAVHTGGLQGIAGMNQHLEKKNLPQILM